MSPRSLRHRNLSSMFLISASFFTVLVRGIFSLLFYFVCVHSKKIGSLTCARQIISLLSFLAPNRRPKQQHTMKAKPSRPLQQKGTNPNNEKQRQIPEYGPNTIHSQTYW